MVVLGGGGLFLMSEVPLYSCPFTRSSQMIHRRNRLASRDTNKDTNKEWQPHWQVASLARVSRFLIKSSRSGSLQQIHICLS